MFRSPIALSLATLLLATSAIADAPYDLQYDSLDSMDTKVDHFWEIDGNVDFVGPARFTTPGVTKDHVDYHLWEVQLKYMQLLGCECDCGMFLGVGYANTGIRWKQNPNFHQDIFNNLCVDIGGFSSHFPGWLWKVDIGACFDADQWEVARYTLYSFTLWGRYELYPCLGVHMGVIAATGLYKDKTWPIIGIDYKWGERIKLNLVYPVDMSALYLLNDNWQIGVAQRLFWTRHRVGADEPVPRSLVEYRNTGTEARVVWIWDPILNVSAHAGYAWGNDLIITDQNDRNGTHYKFDGSYYFGGDLSFKF